MSPATIRARGLSVGWSPTEPLLEDATFDVGEREIFAIMGASGSGKSTLMRVLIGLEQPLAGSLLVAGERPALGVGPPRYGVSFQQGALLGSMSVEDNLALPLSQWSDLPRDAVLAIARARLALVGLDGAEQKLPSELSGGMRKRAAIARALMLEPPLLFLDEPSAGLDPITSAGIDELILTLRRALGITIVLVTHELPSVERTVDRCILLDARERRIVAAGAPGELMASTEPRVSDFFHRRWRTE
jgi:phospholipid/cholesterol/gamma-HCH transport system ATP-binding protein